MSTAMKRQHGVYYTEQNPFTLKPFRAWAKAADLQHYTTLEPFAGANNIPHMLEQLGMCSNFDSYDAVPGADGVMERDTLKRFPTGYRSCVSNPPWLARNSAHRRGLQYPAPRHDDVYKYALELALTHCDYVAFIIPATFIRSNLFRDRLSDFVLLERPMFSETDNPVCLALFTPSPPKRAGAWADNQFLGTLDYLEAKSAWSVKSHAGIRFNAPSGGLGLCGVDNTREPSIRFCRGSELSHRTVRQSDRSITRIDPGVRVTSRLIDRLNATLDRFRADTHDLFLAPFKGLRADGRYRRRLDYSTARGIIAHNV